MSNGQTPTTAEVRKKAFDIIQQLNSKLCVDFRIRDTSAELYGKNIEIASGYDHPKTASDNPIITIIASEHQSLDDAEKSLKHEVYGRYALNTHSPRDKGELLKKIIASKNEPSLKETWTFIETWHPNATPERQAEEVFATIAESHDPAKNKSLRQSRSLAQSSRKTLTAEDLNNEINCLAEGIASGIRTLKTTANEQAETQQDTTKTFIDNLSSWRQKNASRAEEVETSSVDFSPSWRSSAN